MITLINQDRGRVAVPSSLARIRSPGGVTGRRGGGGRTGAALGLLLTPHPSTRPEGGPNACLSLQRMVRHRRSSVLTTTAVVLPDSSHYLLCCRRTGSWLVSMFRGDVRANRGGARATGWGVGASDFLGLCQSLAFAPRRGSVRHTRITSQRGFRRRGCSMAAGEAVQLGG